MYVFEHVHWGCVARAGCIARNYCGWTACPNDLQMFLRVAEVAELSELSREAVCCGLLDVSQTKPELLWEGMNMHGMGFVTLYCFRMIETVQ